MLSHNQKVKQNKLYYVRCPDGVLAAVAFKGSPAAGVPGYLGSTTAAFMKALEAEEPNANQKDLIDRSKIFSVLPVKDPYTHQPKTFLYAQGTKTMAQRAFIFVHEDVANHTDEYADSWCRNITTILNKTFQLEIHYGGNAAFHQFPIPKSLEDLFSAEDVANLAMMSYEESIFNGAFANDRELFKKYFTHEANGRDVFRKVFNIFW